MATDCIGGWLDAVLTAIEQGCNPHLIAPLPQPDTDNA